MADRIAICSYSQHAHLATMIALRSCHHAIICSTVIPFGLPYNYPHCSAHRHKFGLVCISHDAYSTYELATFDYVRTAPGPRGVVENP
jgi:hypothetical protein